MPEGNPMSETSSGNLIPPPLAAAEESSLRTTAMIGYVLLLVASVNGLTAIAAVIIAYIKKRDADGTVWQSHMHNIIVVFWVMALACTSGILTWPLSFGFFLARHFDWASVSVLSVPFLFWFVVFPILLIWFFYRTIRGIIRASESRGY
jgi:uncharacterized membrane protein